MSSQPIASSDPVRPLRVADRGVEEDYRQREKDRVHHRTTLRGERSAGGVSGRGRRTVASGSRGFGGAAGAAPRRGECRQLSSIRGLLMTIPRRNASRYPTKPATGGNQWKSDFAVERAAPKTTPARSSPNAARNHATPWLP